MTFTIYIYPIYVADNSFLPISLLHCAVASVNCRTKYINRISPTFHTCSSSQNSHKLISNIFFFLENKNQEKWEDRRAVIRWG